MPWMWWTLWVIGAYLVGAIPFALLLGRMRGVDIRQVSSGNVGASNLGRTLGRSWGLGCFALDVGKGLVPVFVFGLASGATGWVGAEPSALASIGNALELVSPTSHTLQWLVIAAACILGHVFPVYIGFRGGKGVATSLGALLGIFPYLTFPALAGLVIWLIVVKRSGYVGLASVVGAGAMPLLALASSLAWGLPWRPTGVFVVAITLLSLLVIIRHQPNLARIRAGTETKARWTGHGI